MDPKYRFGNALKNDETVKIKSTGDLRPSVDIV